MEQLEIHSKSYIVRWVDVKGEHTIRWSIQPHKKSINFGIFRHPGFALSTPNLPATSPTAEAPSNGGAKASDGSHEDSSPHSSQSVAVDKLKANGLQLMHWYGNCEANQVTTGTYDVAKKEGGMYALVFDNTFAKSFSKTATFVLLTYPTNAAPPSNHQVRHLPAGGAGTPQNPKVRRSKSRPKLGMDQRQSSDSIPLRASLGGAGASDTLLSSKDMSESSLHTSFYTGILQKRRRKRGQGYARRFFSLDFATSTLSYYHNRNTLSVRGAVPLSLAAIGTNEATREISIDSGAEVWHLKALNSKDFEAWREALESASQIQPSEATSSAGHTGEKLRRSNTGFLNHPRDEQAWQRVEELVSRVSDVGGMARRMAKDTDPKYLPLTASMAGLGLNGNYASSTEASPSEAQSSEGYFDNAERRSFWKRKPSGSKAGPQGKRSISAQAVLPGTSRSRNASSERQQGSTPRLSSFAEESVHDQCMDMLRNLESVVLEFSKLIAESKQRRLQPPVQRVESRLSLESVASQEFFDAEAGEGSQLLTIHQESDEGENDRTQMPRNDQEESSASEIEGDDALERSTVLGDEGVNLWPSRPKNLNLRDLAPRERRITVPAPLVMPPSLIGFLRRNVGKDLSTISMPVSANEPISLLQKAAEQMEYSELLDAAAGRKVSDSDQLLLVTAFAISQLSANRIKERAIRKPFNPMLGETYELIHEGKGFRFVAEKVSHRPVRMAFQADSEKWSVSQSPLPSQKFWGKSAEIITEGRMRLVFHDSGARYSWTPATCFLRNIIAGEKYLEPVNTMSVYDDRSGAHALVTFKSGGMWSGRSEDVVVQAFDPQGAESDTGLAGKWTTALHLTDAESGTSLAASTHPIWQAGGLVSQAQKRYGFTTFAAALNEPPSAADAALLPPSDSRLRPDQRAAENNDLERAEGLKQRLEEAQRERRKAMEESGEQWSPAWFVRVQPSRLSEEEGGGGGGGGGGVGVVGEEEVWRLKTARDGGAGGYWEARAKGDWKGAKRVFELR